MKTYPTLYKRTIAGNQQEWTIIANKNSFYTLEGIVGGKITQSLPNICEMKNVGKINESTAEEQAEIEAMAKWKYKLAHGYTLSLDDIDNVEYKEPMLCKQWEDYKNKVTYPVWVDDKKNGTHCTAEKGILKSRKGKIFNTVPHLIKVLTPVFKKYPNLFIGGELFNEKLKHNLNRLIKLVSVGIKVKDLTTELLKESEEIVEFHCFDCYGFNNIDKNTPFIARRKALRELVSGLKGVFVLDYVECKNEADVERLKEKSIKDGGEGIIIRWGDCPYEHKRSKFCLKYKNFVDEEFEVLGFEEGNGNWAGCVKMVICKLKTPTPDGKTDFKSNISGTQEELSDLWTNQKKYVGQFCTVVFQELSEFGVPLIPYTSLPFRTYE